MGNTVIKQTGLLNETTDLGKYIKEWSNSYQIQNGLDQNVFSDTLKKRACCTVQTTIPIGMAGIDNGKIVNYKVSVPIFNKVEEITPGNCMLKNRNGDNASYAGKSESGKPFGESDECIYFYKQFGEKVKQNRSIHPDLGHRLYGINNDVDDEKQIANQFIDCNCQNGIYQDPVIKSGQGVDSWQYEQILDLRCNNYSTKTYKPYIKDVGEICLNIVNVGGAIEAKTGGTIKIQQSCQSKLAKEEADARDKELREKQEKADKEAKDIADAAATQKELDARNAQAAAESAKQKAADEVQWAKDQAAKKAADDAKAAAAGTTGTTDTTGTDTTGTDTTTPESSNMMMIYGGVGLLICIILIVIFFMLSGSGSKSKK